jgi:21S rRNA (GM2251-2'-O)-methyltransferase
MATILTFTFCITRSCHGFSLVAGRRLRGSVFLSTNSNLMRDEEGRNIRKRSRQASNTTASDWDDFNAWDVPQQRESGGGWDDFEPPRGAKINSDQPKQRFGGRGTNKLRGTSPRNARTFVRKEKDTSVCKINLSALEKAGFIHLYGLASCLNALQANRRDFTRPEAMINLDELQGEDLEHELRQRERKPEAQFSPWLFVQVREKGATTNRSHDKSVAAEKIEALATERGIPVARVDKGVLNTLCGNRPHQGYVLRCGKLDFEPVSSLKSDCKLWLCLDEVVDPQNLGALLRSAHFLSSSSINKNTVEESSLVRVVVTAKNSAPPSPVTSAASAGALELSKVYETNNLPKLLSQAQQDGFRIFGASLMAPSSSSAAIYTLPGLVLDPSCPTVLVLGSEGNGLRTLVAKACTDFVCIPGGDGGVDSLNVSVTGGIMLWHMLQSLKR